MSPKLRLPRFRYTLRTLLLVMTVLAIWLGIKFDQARRQERARRVFQAFGICEYAPLSFAETSINVGFRGAVDGAPFAPQWLVNIVGMDALASVHTLVLSAAARDPPSKHEVGDAELVYLRDLPRVESMMLDSGKITDEGLVHLGHLRQLKVLALVGDGITDDGLRHLARLDKLRYLSLASSQLTDAGLAHLAALNRLRHLTLSSRRVTDAGLAHLAGLNELRELELHCSITDKGLQRLASLAKLESLISCGTAVSQTRDTIFKLDEPSALQMSQMPLSDVAEFLADYHRIEFQLGERSMKEKGIPLDAPVTCDFPNVPLAAALDGFVEPLGLDWMVVPDGIVITTREVVSAKQAGLERLKSQLPGLKRAYVCVDW